MQLLFMKTGDSIGGYVATAEDNDFESEVINVGKDMSDGCEGRLVRKAFSRLAYITTVLL